LYPSMKKYLAPDAQIIHSAEFDSAVVKIMSLVESTLTCSEKNVMSPFLLNVPNDVTEEESKSKMSFMEKIDYKRKRMMEEHGPKTKYVDLQFLLSTSNVVERLFSLARLILTDQRKSMSPIVFEAMLYLQKNREYWSVIDVAQAMRNTLPEKNDDA
jgi:hypothetical protein